MKSGTWSSWTILVVMLASTGTVTGVGTRTVETTALVGASPECVLRAFIDRDDLKGWWKVSRSLVEARPGGVWAVAWDEYGENEIRHAWVGVVETAEPRHLTIGHLVMIEPHRPLFGPLQLEIVATPAEGDTLLTVYHRGYRSGEQWDWIHDAVVKGWRNALGDLRKWFLEYGCEGPY